MASSWFNEDQQEYMRFLAEKPPETRCWCGWYPLGECPNCPPGKTCADKMKIWCPECHNEPNGSSIIHTIGCSRRTR